MKRAHDEFGIADADGARKKAIEALNFRMITTFGRNQRPSSQWRGERHGIDPGRNDSVMERMDAGSTGDDTSP